MEEYTKAALTHEQQITLLEERGLSVGSRKDAIIFLQQVNYYRFSAYCSPFQTTPDTFAEGTTFREIVGLYLLDENLRNAMMSVLSPIEIFLRTHTVYELSHGWGSFVHYEPSRFRVEEKHTEWVDSLNSQVSQSNERFLEHYRAKYHGFPRLPLWIACEVMSMGTLSLLYKNLLPGLQRRICSIVECHQSVLVSWMHVITYLRNICAHHGRLWNREFQIRPLILRDSRWAEQGLDNAHLFAVVAMMEWIYRKAGLDFKNFDIIFDVMRKISDMNPTFSIKMGVPAGKPISLCWNE